jgi:hypothetical protein
MSASNKLVIYTSEAELAKHAAGYPCLVNYNPFDKTGEIDDGCGHFAHVTFVAADPNSEPELPAGEFDTVVFVGFPMRNFRPQDATACNKEQE